MATGHPTPGGYGGKAPGPFTGKSAGGVYYREVNAVQDPFCPGLDPTGKRVMFQCNFSAVKRPSTTFHKEIAERLEDEGVGTRNTNIFIGPKKEISGDDGPYLIINLTGGAAPSWVHNQDTPFMENPTVQLTVVALSYDDAKEMIDNAYDALVGIKNEDLYPT